MTLAGPFQLPHGVGTIARLCSHPRMVEASWWAENPLDVPFGPRLRCGECRWDFGPAYIYRKHPDGSYVHDA